MAQHTPTADAKFAQHVVQDLLDRGCPDDTIRAALGKHYTVLGKSRKRIPVESMTRLYRAASDAIDDPLLGAHLGFDANAPQMGTVAKLLIASATLRLAIKSMIRFRRLVTDIFDCDFIEGEKLSEVRYRLSQPIDCSHHQYDAIAAAFKKVLDTLCDTPEVLFEFTHDDRGRPDEYERLYQGRIRFNAGMNRIVFPSVYLNARAGLRCDKLHEQTLAEAREAMHELAIDTSVSHVVRQYILDVLSDGEPTIQDAAEHLGIRPRTLQARLADEDISFRSLLNDTRLTLAQNLLREHRHTNEAIARQLGYRDVRAYYSAFKRWTGHTPQAYLSQN